MRRTHLVRVLVTSTKTTARLVLGEELDVGSTAVETFLQLDLVLHDEGLALRVDRLGEESGDGVVGGLGLCARSARAFATQAILKSADSTQRHDL
jgi:hypothetical protein